MTGRCLTCALAVALSAVAFAGQPEWEVAIRELDYLVHYNSLLNIVNGTNLTAQQATKLRALALEIGAQADPPPSLKAKLSQELEGVRRAYTELSQVLLQGQAVPAELERRVVAARAAHARFVRATLLPRPVGKDLACANCHAEPRPGGEPMALTQAIRFQADMAHCLADYGPKGLVALVRVSPQVENLLTDAQKAVFDGFTCCLVPPQDLSDPVRAGQAEAGEKELELLRLARQAPANQWAAVREEILRHMDPVAELYSPGVTTRKKAGVREGVGKALDRARKLSEVEFEVEKNELAKAVKGAIQPPAPDGPHRAAFFLLIPGSARVYASYLGRLGR